MITKQSIKADMEMLAACARRDAQRREQARADAAAWAGKSYWQTMGLAARHVALMGRVALPAAEEPQGEPEPEQSRASGVQPVALPRKRGRPRKWAS